MQTLCLLCHCAACTGRSCQVGSGFLAVIPPGNRSEMRRMQAEVPETRWTMLLRIRVRLPDRPGSLGKVARILGAAGADVVQMAVLERVGGRALDDFTVAWPAGSSIDRLLDGLVHIPGVEVEGVWPTVEPHGA